MLSQYLVCDYCYVIKHQPQLSIDSLTEIWSIIAGTPPHLRDHAPAQSGVEYLRNLYLVVIF